MRPKPVTLDAVAALLSADLAVCLLARRQSSFHADMALATTADLMDPVVLSVLPQQRYLLRVGLRGILVAAYRRLPAF